MEIAVVPYTISIERGGKTYDVHVAKLSVPKCTNCGELSFDEAATDQIEEAFRKKANDETLVTFSEETRKPLLNVDRDFVLSLLASPPKPNAALKKAAEEHRRRLGT